MNARKRLTQVGMTGPAVKNTTNQMKEQGNQVSSIKGAVAMDKVKPTGYTKIKGTISG